jgi:hypothetical protein
MGETPERLTGVAGEILAKVADDLTRALADSRGETHPKRFLEAWLVGYIQALRKRVEK